MNSKKQSNKYSMAIILFAFVIVCVISISFGTLKQIASAEDELYETSKNLYSLTIYYKIKNTDIEIYPKLHITEIENASYCYESPEITNYVLADSDDATISGILNRNKEINVYYESVEDLVPYTINYYTMNPDGTEIRLIDQVKGSAKANETVNVPMFDVQGYAWDVCDLLLLVTADGKAVKNIYFVKSSGQYSIVIRTGTGYARTITASTGADITANIEDIFNNPPTRLGYEFVRWDNDKLAQGVAEHATILMTDHDVIVNAIWEESTVATYHVEFWFENLEDDNYTKNGAFDRVRYARVGAKVGALPDDITLADENALYPGDAPDGDTLLVAAELKDIFSKYNLPTCDSYVSYRQTPFFGFDYNAELTEKQTVEPDGSTVLRIYYKRELWSHLVYDLDSSQDITDASFTDDKIIPQLSTINGKFGEKLKYSNMSYETVKSYFTGIPADRYFLYIRSKGNDNLSLNVAETVLKSHVVHRYANTSQNTMKTLVHTYMYQANLNETMPSADLSEENHHLMAKETRGNVGTNTKASYSTFIIQGSTYLGSYYRYATTKEGLATATWQPTLYVAAPGVTTEMVENSTVSCFDRIDKDENDKNLFNYINLSVRLTKTVINGVLYSSIDADEKPPEMYFEIWCPRETHNIHFVPNMTIVGSTPQSIVYPQGASFDFMFTETGDLKPEYVLTEIGGDYTMEGWYFDGAFETKVTPDSIMPIVDETLYAKWLPNFATVTFDSMGGTDIEKVKLQYGQSLIESDYVTTKENFEFVGWYDEKGLLFNFYQEITQDIALHAVWKPYLAVDYTVYHVLVNDDSSTQVLDQFTVNAFGKVGEPVIASALGAGVSLGSLYLSPDDASHPTITITLNVDPALNVATFYYHTQSTWGYTVEYRSIRGSNEIIQASKTVSSTDTLLVTELALNIPGYSSLALDENMDAQYGTRGVGYQTVELDNFCTPSNKVITFYYDVVNHLVFDEQNGNTTTRNTLYKEEVTVQKATSDTMVFLGWNTKADGSGINYVDNDTLIFDGEDVQSSTLTSGVTHTLYAQWANPTASIVPGRLLDRVDSTNNKNASIAKNGAYTAVFALESDNDGFTITPNDLTLTSATTFPANAKLTLIWYTTPTGNLNAEQYYYIVPASAQSISLTSFVSFVDNSAFSKTQKAKDIWCQICIVYPSTSYSLEHISLSVNKEQENNTKLNVSFTSPIQEKFSGTLNIETTADTKPTYQGTLTVSNLAGFGANQSSEQNTSGTMQNLTPTVVMYITDNHGKIVPFSDLIKVTINDEVVKDVGGLGNIKWKIPFAVTNGTYNISITGLTYYCHNIHFRLCGARGENEQDMLYSMPKSASVGAIVNAVLQGEVSLIPENAMSSIKATLGDAKLNDHVRSKSACANKTIKFDYTYVSQAEVNQVVVKVYMVKNDNSGSTAEIYEELNWNYTVKSTGAGKGEAIVQVPANLNTTETALGTTYRFEFILNDIAKSTWDIIITND